MLGYGRTLLERWLDLVVEPRTRETENRNDLLEV